MTQPTTLSASRTSNSSLGGNLSTRPPPVHTHAHEPVLSFSSLRPRIMGSKGNLLGIVGQGTPKVFWWRFCVAEWLTFARTAPLTTPPSPPSSTARHGSRYAVTKSPRPSVPSSVLPVPPSVSHRRVSAPDPSVQEGQWRSLWRWWT